MASLTDEMRDPNTPDDVVVTLEPREPVTDPTLGVQVQVAADGAPKHRLVTIGDSLTHGFQSGAIFNTSWSYPAIIARRLGWFDHFRYPTYNGFGGLPINIEYLLREMEEAFGDRIDWYDAPLALFRIRDLTDQMGRAS